jgi:protease I
MIIAPSKFRDEELLKPRALLQTQGYQVDVAALTASPATGMLGTVCVPDKTLDQLDAASYDAIVFVGGAGARTYWDNATCHALAQAAVAKGKVLGAICLAPVILARAGVLKGVPATVWPSARPELAKTGARVSTDHVVTHGLIVTGDGPDSALPFGQALIAALQKRASQPPQVHQQ